MYYNQRNLDNIEKLAPNTKKATLELYNFAVQNNIEILIHETIRTLEQQKINVAKGASQTMKSYHLVGQAFDFVPTSEAVTDWNGYKREDIRRFIEHAKSLGFEWGGDWTSFVDPCHMQFNYIGYGTDKELAGAYSPQQTRTIADIQAKLNELGYVGSNGKTLTVDGINGDNTKYAVRAFQKLNGLAVDGIAGVNTQAVLFGDNPKRRSVVPAPTLKTGSRGDEVKLLQSLLGGLTADGIFGAKTDARLKDWQRSHGLSADGIYGIKTQAKFREVF